MAITNGLCGLMRNATAGLCSSAAICPKRKSARASKAASPDVIDTQASIPSLADRVRSLNAGAPVVGAHFIAATPVFVLGEESLIFAGETERRVPVHSGAILASACDGERIVTGGDDGKLIETNANGEHRE